jgi:hypothetical protein
MQLPIVIAKVDLRNERCNFAGIVLKVSVHGDNDVPLSKIEARVRPGSLPEILS